MAGGKGAEDRWAAQREAMVREQLMARGIRDERVLAAFRKVRRELFVPDAPAPTKTEEAEKRPSMLPTCPCTKRSLPPRLARFCRSTCRRRKPAR